MLSFNVTMPTVGSGRNQVLALDSWENNTLFPVPTFILSGAPHSDTAWFPSLLIQQESGELLSRPVMQHAAITANDVEHFVQRFP